jgi:hypothetical protein
LIAPTLVESENAPSLINMSLDVTESMYAILDYLKEHPDASDTVEGIGWWFLEQRVSDCANDVQLAVAQLRAKGLVIEVKGRDDRRHYQLNKSRVDEIASILHERRR